jgi:photosystem II stability/assembly factor-like uncharacterized protein
MKILNKKPFKNQFFIYCFVIFHLFIFQNPHHATAQWQSVANGTGNGDLNECKFISPCKGIAVGGNGRVLQTLNAGSSWTEYSVSTLPFQQRPWLHSLDFVNDSTLFAVGGGCFKSTDFGITWTDINCNMTTTALFDIDFITPQIGYIAGGNGNIIKTSDGGNTWTLQTCNVSDEIHSVSFVHPDTGWVVSYSKIAHTTDGGMTWIVQKTDFSAGYWDCFAMNGTTCFATGWGGRIEKTIDGGQTWTMVNTTPQSDILSIDFCDSLFGYAVGGQSTILKTIDGGNNWNPVILGTSYDILFSVDCITPDYSYIVGGSVAYNSDFSCFTIDASAVGPGTIEPEGIQTVPGNSSFTFTFNPGNQASVSQLMIDGVILPVPTSNTYTFDSISENHIIAVFFLVGINEMDLNFNVFPNPASNELFIHRSSESSDPITFEIVDILGNIQIKGCMNNKEQTIPLESLKPSIYILKIVERNQTTCYKIIKN